MESAKIEDVKRGDFIRRKPDSHKTYTRDRYCRFEKKYICGDWEDINREILLKRGTVVYIGFEF